MAEQLTPGQIAGAEGVAIIEGSGLSIETKAIIGAFVIPALLEKAPEAHHYLAQCPPAERTAAAETACRALAKMLLAALDLDAGAKAS